MTTGSDEQRPAPPTADLLDVINIYEMTFKTILEEMDSPHEKEFIERTLANAARFLVDSAAERAPAQESLPVGTDPPCVTCGHPHGAHVMDNDACDDCVGGMCRTPPPVGTDSARAEAERRYPENEVAYSARGMVSPEVQSRRDAFEEGAEWARAEERKARGE